MFSSLQKFQISVLQLSFNFLDNRFASNITSNITNYPIEYRYEGGIVCEHCGNEISFRISGYEYPVGAFNYEDCNITGGRFEEEPHMGVIYSRDDFDPDDVRAIPEPDRYSALPVKVSGAECSLTDRIEL